MMNRRPRRKVKTWASLVLPGPRRADRRRRRALIIWSMLTILLIAIGWLGYRELSSTTQGSVEFSGP